jgi:exosome complex component RRP43
MDENNASEVPQDDYNEVIANNLLVPNIELNTGCSPKYLPGVPPSVEAQAISQRLLDLLHGSRLVKKEGLKIYYMPPPDEEGEELVERSSQLMAYWCLYIDLVCISHGGNVFDAAWLAVCAALRDTVLPRGWWDADLREVRCSAEREEARKLEMSGMPVSLSWGVFVPENRMGSKFAEEMWVLCDLDAFEEDCCLEGGCMVVDMDEEGKVEILKLEKIGGARVDLKELKMLFGTAEKRWKVWEKVLMAG